MLLGLLLAAQILVSLLLIGAVLLQRSEGGGFVGGGSPSGMMSVRGAGDLMTRITWTLGALFFIISLLLTILAGREGRLLGRRSAEGRCARSHHPEPAPRGPAACRNRPAGRPAERAVAAAGPDAAGQQSVPRR